VKCDDLVDCAFKSARFVLSCEYHQRREVLSKGEEVILRDVENTAMLSHFQVVSC
jgi:hypothetical protein